MAKAKKVQPQLARHIVGTNGHGLCSASRVAEGYLELQQGSEPICPICLPLVIELLNNARAHSVRCQEREANRMAGQAIARADARMRSSGWPGY